MWNPVGRLSIIRKPANSKVQASRAKGREKQQPVGRGRLLTAVSLLLAEAVEKVGADSFFATFVPVG